VDGRVATLEAVVSRPELRAKSCNRSSRVLDNAPAEVGLVIADIVEEIIRENSFLARNHIELLFVLDVAEMHPAVEGESLVSSEAAECLVDLHLVQGSVLEAATRDSRARPVDLVYCSSKSV